MISNLISDGQFPHQALSLLSFPICEVLATHPECPLTNFEFPNVFVKFLPEIESRQ